MQISSLPAVNHRALGAIQAKTAPLPIPPAGFKLCLPETDSFALGRDLEVLSASIQNDEPLGFLVKHAGTVVGRHLSPNLTRALEILGKGEGPPYLVIDNLPIGRVPSPPTDGWRPQDKDWYSEANLLGLMQAAKLEPFSYAQEHNGRLVTEVAPKRGQEVTSSAVGTQELFGHTDDSFFKPQYRPDYLGLICLNNEAAVATHFIPTENLLAALTPGSAEVLFEDRFRMQMPESFRLGGERIYGAASPILRRLDGAIAAAFSINVVPDDPGDLDALAAIDDMRTALKRASQDIVMLRPGQAVIWDNRRLLHCRGPVNGSRWLQRTFARRSLDALREACKVGPETRQFDVRQLIFA